MSGHSKWSTIKRKKEKTDAQRAKIFTKLGREISVAVKSGGADSGVNSRLKDIIAKAKANNMPNDNIMRCIKKAEGEQGGANFEEIMYEGYGPKGVAVIVEATTDNKNRTAADMRHYFDKCGGNLGQSGCVSYMFDRKGVIIIERGEKITDDEILSDALECGAEDITFEQEYYEVLTDAAVFSKVCDALEGRKYSFVSAEIQYIPQTTVMLSDEKDVAMMNKLVELLEENDDVNSMWHNCAEEDT